MKYIVSLPDYEKSLLLELAQLYQLTDANVTSNLNEDAVNALRESLFTHWSWAHSVREYLQDSLSDDSETLIEDFNGDKSAAYADSLHWLASGGGSQQALFRVRRMDEQNPNFIARLGHSQVNRIEYVPADTDAHFWSILARAYMISDFPAPETVQGTLLTRSSYDMWKLIHKLAVCVIRPDNFQLVTDHLILHSIFRTRYVFKEGSSSNELIENPGAWGRSKGLQVYDREALKTLDTIDASQIDRTFSAVEDENEYDLGAYLKKLGAAQPIDDPRTFLHFLPWHELQTLKRTECDPESLLNIEPMTESPCDLWLAWKAPHRTPKLLDHLHTEDEVGQYCYQRDWEFSGHSVGQSVVFRATVLKSSGFIEDLKLFWESWNDCTITQNPTNKELLLLETIPGIQWRRLKQQRDVEAARTFFRNLVESHAREEPSLDVLQQMLGDNYSPKYENLLRLIPENQITDVQPEPLGEGVNGAVYAAPWNRPSGRLITTKRQQNTPVVLKQILSKHGEEEMEKKLIQELDVTFTALGGSMLGCVPLLGLTIAGSKALPFDRKSEPHESQSHPKPTLQLVFERASEGSLLASARKQLEDGPESKSWAILVDILNSIASGLDTLHKHHVVHRDLHPNNLATKKYFATDPNFKSEVRYLISDIGEGKNLSERDLHVVGASMGAKQFRAPEIRGGKGWTVKADVFAFGVLACKLLDLRDQVCGDAQDKEDTSQSESTSYVRSIPERLRKPLEACMTREPDQRPSMRGVIRILDDFSVVLLSKEPVMVTWDWNKTLADARTHGNRVVAPDEDYGSLASIFMSDP